MAFVLDENRTTEYKFSESEIGTYAFNEDNCQSASNVSYKFRLTIWFNSIDKVNRKLNASANSRLWSGSGSAFSGYSVVTKVFVDGVESATKTIKSLDKGSNVAGAQWTGDLQYNEDGKAEATFKATLSCSSTAAYPPKSCEVQIKVAFADIEALSKKSFKVHINGEFKDSVAYVFTEDKWTEAVAYVRNENEWKEGA